MTKTNESAARSARRSPAGKHRARGFVDKVLRSDARSCRRGEHLYRPPTPIGGGIRRSTCAVCGSVSIDVREASVPQRPTRLFRYAGFRRRD